MSFSLPSNKGFVEGKWATFGKTKLLEMEDQIFWGGFYLFFWNVKERLVQLNFFVVPTSFEIELTISPV